MVRSNRPDDTYRYDAGDVADFEERFTLEPVPPAVIRDRIADGEVLVTTDIPELLGRSIATPTDTSIALYRLVQLFGTPNVPGLEAGGDQPMRELTTWQYLFRISYRPEAVDESLADREFLVSVYDYRTNLSVGLSEWHSPDDDPGRGALEPSAEPLPSGDVPDEAVLEQFVQLVLSTVEHAVEATFEGLHV